MTKRRPRPSTKKSRRLPETAKERKVDMLTTSIGLIQKYDYLEEKFKKGYEFLRNTDLKALPLGRVDIDGDEVFASVQEYTTMPADACRYESHDPVSYTHLDVYKRQL